MSDPRLFRLRVTFCKQGRLAMLSHLEVARALERAVRRAGLPYAVSQGFSPHMKIAFGAALPVGVGGSRECFDLQLERYVAPERVLEVLQAVSAPDLMVKSCRYLEPSAPAASVAFPVSTYRALLSCAPAALPVPKEVRIVRKKKEKRLAVADFLVGDLSLTGAVVTFSLEAKPTGSLRPDVLLSSCIDAYNNGISPDDEAFFAIGQSVAFDDGLGAASRAEGKARVGSAAASDMAGEVDGACASGSPAGAMHVGGVSPAAMREIDDVAASSAGDVDGALTVGKMHANVDVTGGGTCADNGALADRPPCLASAAGGASLLRVISLTRIEQRATY